MPIEYPRTAKVDQIDDYHGTKVEDPYRWLEEQDSPDTSEWVTAQNALTFGELEKLDSRKALKERLTKLWEYEKFAEMVKESGRYFYLHNDGIQNQSVLYTLKTLDDEPRLLLDPNTWSEDGTVALMLRSVSKEGRYLAYSQAEAGSDWSEYFVIDIDSGEKLGDHIKWIKFSVAAWDHESRGFFYSGYGIPESGEYPPDEPNYFVKIFYHKLGTPQESDTIIYERPDIKDLLISSQVSEDGRYLVISASVGAGFDTRNTLYYKDLSDPCSEVIELIGEFDSSYGFVGNDGPIFWVLTDLDAPNKRLVEIDIRSPERSSWKEVIPEGEQMLQSMALIGGRFVCHYLKDAHSRLAIYDLKGQYERDVELPGIGAVADNPLSFGISGHPDDPEFFYTFQSFINPPTIFRCNVSTGDSALWKKPEIDFDADGYETRQVFYRSKDGTRVPMFIVYKKGLKLDGSNRTYLTGYGGFGIPKPPLFNVPILAWLERGGIFAIPNLRGGSEYGIEWHRAGMLHNKQNVFDDFIAAAEWLIENKYTSKENLAIGGGRNGGLLVGACLTQRPDLYAAVQCNVGVLDMLRFDEFTIGYAWAPEYGSPKNPDHFKTLYEYSPLHNVKAGTSYPAVLVTTAGYDDRVVPGHSFKFAATLQEAQAGAAPILLRVETRAGHGLGKPTWMMIEEFADFWAFLEAHT